MSRGGGGGRAMILPALDGPAAPGVVQPGRVLADVHRVLADAGDPRAADVARRAAAYLARAVRADPGRRPARPVPRRAGEHAPGGGGRGGRRLSDGSALGTATRSIPCRRGPGAPHGDRDAAVQRHRGLDAPAAPAGRAASGEALSAQRSLLRQAFARSTAREMGTEGDSFFVVFPLGARRGARRRSQAQRELHAPRLAGRRAGAGADGPAHRRAAAARGRLHRHRRAPRGPDRRRRPRRPDRALGGRPQQLWSADLGRRCRCSATSAGTGSRTSPSPSTSTDSSAPGLRRDFPPLRSLGSARQPPGHATPLDRAGGARSASSGAARRRPAPPGDADRPRRLGQDPARARPRPARWAARFPRRRLLRAAARGHRRRT